MWNPELDRECMGPDSIEPHRSGMPMFLTPEDSSLVTITIVIHVYGSLHGPLRCRAERHGVLR